MEQHGVGKHAVEMRGRQVEREQVLLPDFAAAVAARHGRELRCALQADRAVAELRKGLEVAPRTAAQVQDAQGRRAPHVAQQRRDVLADVVIARALPEVGGPLLVVRERRGGDAVEFFARQGHRRIMPQGRCAWGMCHVRVRRLTLPCSGSTAWRAAVAGSARARGASARRAYDTTW
jgi:hypothetical protein